MRFLSLLLLSALISACSKPSPNVLTIGTLAGPESELVEVARDVAKEQYGLEVKIIEFNDYNLPNEALLDGSLDANIYQHLPYLQAAMKARHYEFSVLGKTFIYPTAIYSKKFKTLHQLPLNALIAIPNDPSNETRALLLLQKAGLIGLKIKPTLSLADITRNPKHLQIKELDAAQLPHVLNDVDAAVINTTFAIPAGLNPLRDGLFMENKNSPYANLIVINANSTKKEPLKLFTRAMHSKAVQEKAKALFGDAAVPAW